MGGRLERAVNHALDEWLENDGSLPYDALAKRREWMIANPDDAAYLRCQAMQRKKVSRERDILKP